jgi:hypothetical protein
MRGLRMSDDLDRRLREQLVNGETLGAVMYDPGWDFGNVEISIDGTEVAWADWGNWHWQAEGTDRERALGRLEDRLSRLDPFDGFDTDWGDPGYKLVDGEPIDERIHEDTRQRMERWNSEYVRRSLWDWKFGNPGVAGDPDED